MSVTNPKGRNLWYWEYSWQGVRHRSRGGYSTKQGAMEAEAEYRRENGHLKPAEMTSFHLEGLLSKQLKTLLALSGNGPHPQVEKSFCEAMEEYLEECSLEGQQSRGIGQKRRFYYDKVGRSLHRPIHEFDEKKVREILATHKGRIAPRTLNKYRSNLGALMAWAKKKGYVSENPTLNIKPLKIQRTRPYSPPLEDVGRIQLALPPRYEPIFIVAKWTGQRISDVLNLRWDQVDLEGRMIYFEVGKTKKLNPIPMLSRELVETLERLYAKRDKRCGFIFPNKQTMKPYDNIRRVMQEASKRAGLEVAIRCHDLRRSLATEMYRMGIPVGIISQVLAHSRTSTTEQHYLGPVEDAKIEAIRRYVNAFEKASGDAPEQTKDLSHFVGTYRNPAKD